MVSLAVSLPATYTKYIQCILYYKNIKGKSFNPTVLGCAQTPEGHFREVQNVSHHSL